MGRDRKSDPVVDRRDLERAADLYRDFREEEPRAVGELVVSLPSTVAEVGVCQFIGYVTTQGRKTTSYVHGFVKGSRPHLYSSGRRNELFLFGGRFRMTRDGIVDLNPDGSRAREYTVEELRAMLALKA
jgi:hypothetical protein